MGGSRQMRRFWITLFMVGILYLVVRTKITGTLAGDFPTSQSGKPRRGSECFTALRISLEWVRLLLWPAHLQADYSPRDIERATSFGLQQAAGLTLLLGVRAITLATWKRLPVVAFGLCWTAPRDFPVSNLVLKAGILLAERTLFVPSVGAMMVLGGATEALTPPSCSLAGNRSRWRASSSSSWARGAVQSVNRCGRTTEHSCSDRRGCSVQLSCSLVLRTLSL